MCILCRCTWHICQNIPYVDDIPKYQNITYVDDALNCGVGEDSWESLGLQGDPASPS